MAFNFITELWYWIWNTPYYKIMVLKDMEKIKYIVQKVVSKEQGYNFFIIDTSLKMAWLKMSEQCFRDGKKFLGFADVDNAILLIEENRIKTIGDMITKEITIKRLKSEKVNIEKPDKGKLKKFSEITFPPKLLFLKIEAHFITEALKNPESKFEQLKWAIIGIAICIVIIVFILTSGGKLGALGI